MASYFPQNFRDIDTIRLNNISIVNANNTLPSTGTVLTVSSAKAYMLPITAALDASPGLSSLSTQLSTLRGSIGTSASNWSYYSALSTVNINNNGVQNVNFLKYIGCTASNRSFASGFQTKASGNYSHSEGYVTTASAPSAHAEGTESTASGQNSHAEGGATQASAFSAHSEGYLTVASGQYSHTEGYSTQATSDAAHAEGSSTTASGSAAHAEGQSTTASGDNSHAEGQNTVASAFGSHAEGQFTLANGTAAHAQGYNCIATSGASHACGWKSETLGISVASFASGVSSIASNYADTVIGYGGRSRLATNMVFSSGPILSNITPIYGSAQRTYFNLISSNAANPAASYQSYTLKYYTDYDTTTGSQIPFVTLADNKPVAFQYTVKLTGYQQSNISLVPEPPASGIFFGEYNFFTFIDTSLTPALVSLDNSVAVNGPFTNQVLPATYQLDRFAFAPLPAPPYIKPTQLLADINVGATNTLVLKVNTASMTKANWVAQVERLEIALPY